MPNDNVSSLQYYVTDISAALTYIGNLIPISRAKSLTVTTVTILFAEICSLAVRLKKGKAIAVTGREGP
jgi:hypothetical protein